MTATSTEPSGGCACGEIRYRLTARPMFVHCCHCRWCQRETGSAFVTNALIETSRVDVTKGAPAPVKTPSESGQGQIIVRCPSCQVAVWSHYAGMGPNIAFLRAGTLDDPGAFPPDIHIFTSSKQSWVRFDDGAPIVPEYYRRSDYWSAEAIKRFQAARGR